MSAQSKIDGLVARAATEEPTEEARTSAWLAIKLMKKHGGSIRLVSVEQSQDWWDISQSYPKSRPWGVDRNAPEYRNRSVQDIIDDLYNASSAFRNYSTQAPEPKSDPYPPPNAKWRSVTSNTFEQCWGCKRYVSRNEPMHIKLGRSAICNECFQDEAK